MADILDLIESRRSMRAPFDPQRPIARDDLARILGAARWAPTAHNMQNFEVVVVEDPRVMDRIRAIRRPPSEAFIRENYEQLSFSEEELREKKTGIMGTMFPPAWRDPDFRLDAFTPEELEAMSRPMPDAPVLLVVTYDPSRRAPASEGDFLGAISLGCVMQNLWLEAASLGIGMHVVSSLSSDPEVKTILGIPDDRSVAFSCRLGYPVEERSSYIRVRRDVEDFAHEDACGDPWVP